MKAQDSTLLQRSGYSFEEQISEKNVKNSEMKNISEKLTTNQRVIMVVFVIFIFVLCFGLFGTLSQGQQQTQSGIRRLFDNSFGNSIGFLLKMRGYETKYQESPKEKGNITINLNGGAQFTLPFQKSTFITFDKVEEQPLPKIVYTPRNDVSENATEQEADFEAFKKKGQHNISMDFIANIKNNDSNIDFFEYMYFNEKYKLDEEVTENSFCFISPSRNLISRRGESSFKLYLYTLEHQNYSNFEVIISDDFSDDNSPLLMADIISEGYPRLRNRVTIVKNSQRIGALGNRDITSRNYCKPGSIIAQLDADDALLGKQVLNVMNRLYIRNPNKWFIYSSFLEFRYTQNKVQQGKYSEIFDLSFQGLQIDWQKMDSTKYRSMAKQWGTSHFKTYLRELYMKVPIQYLFQNGSYHLLATDRFNVYAMVQLAGSKRMMYLSELFYMYRNAISPADACHYQYSYLKQYEARKQTPLMPLSSLDDTPRKVQNYKIPSQIISISRNYIKSYEKCVKKMKLKKGQIFRT